MRTMRSKPCADCGAADCACSQNRPLRRGTDSHLIYPHLTIAEVRRIRRIHSTGRLGRTLSWQAICARPSLARQILDGTGYDDGFGPTLGEAGR